MPGFFLICLQALAFSSAMPAQYAPISRAGLLENRFSLDLGEGFILHFEDVRIDEGGAIYQRATLYRKEELIFRDDLNAFQLSDEYPRLIVRKDGYELLLQTKTSLYLSNILLLRIRSDKVIAAQRLPMPILPMQDLDEDGWPEGFGFLEEYQEIDANTVSYAPILAWQNTSEGISIDTIASMKLTKMVFGQYNGLEANPKLTCLCRQRVESKLSQLRTLSTN